MLAVTMLVFLPTTHGFTISSLKPPQLRRHHQQHQHQHQHANRNTLGRNANILTLALSGPSTPDGDETSPVDYTNMQPQVYPQRWVQLGYLSILALLSDWICFSVAAAPETFEASFHGHSAASLIDIFLFTNVASCFLVTDIVAKIGLQRSIQGAAILMTVGCWFRSGFAFLVPVAHAVGIQDDAILHVANQWAATTLTTADLGSSSSSTIGLVPYPFIIIGTLMVGAAQPFFQCTPPLLSAQWFGSDERATSTAVALNFNQIGIATAFLVGGAMATDPIGLEQYFGLVSVLCTVVAVGTALQFQNLPPTPPSSSELEKWIRGETEPPFLESVQTFFATPGFTRPLAAFVCSITITNVVGVRVFFRFSFSFESFV